MGPLLSHFVFFSEKHVMHGLALAHQSARKVACHRLGSQDSFCTAQGGGGGAATDAHRFLDGGGPRASGSAFGGNIFALGRENGLDGGEHSTRERL